MQLLGQLEHLDELVGGAPQRRATAMHRVWVDFAVHGDPGWPAYEVPGRATMRFDEVDEVVADLAGAERELWDGVG